MQLKQSNNHKIKQSSEYSDKETDRTGQMKQLIYESIHQLMKQSDNLDKSCKSKSKKVILN